MFELQGVEEFLTAMKKKGDLLESQQEKIIMAGAKILKSEIEARAPVLTGNLKQHIVITELKKGSEGAFVYVGPSDPGKAFYAKFLEFGSKYIRARPFVEPAYLSVRSQMLVAMATAAKKIIEDSV